MNKAAKITVLSALILECLLVFAAPVLAAYTAGPEWTHGNYTNNTNACAGCHVTHAAPAPHLLNQGPTITHFCYVCHGQGAPGAPYDIQLGRTMAYDSVYNRTVWYPSTAGGFEGLMVPDEGVEYSVYGATYNPVTSRHNVSGYVGETDSLDDTDLSGDYFVPGGVFALNDNGLECTSCHSPHGGGLYPGMAVNPRLLKIGSKVGGVVYQNTYMEMRLAWLGTTTVNQYAYRVISYDNFDTYSTRRDLYNSSAGYDTGSNSWCGFCHSKFNTRTPSGRTPDSYGMYRHAMNVPAPAAFLVPGSPDKGTPLEAVKISDSGSTIRKVACLTCHRAHSTTAAMAGAAATWQRSEGGTGTTSALLRMDNRGVCYNCHGAAERNTVNTSVYRHDPGWTGTDCWNCHNT
jgi:predicted CXXCH cytochrome family protein